MAVSGYRDLAVWQKAMDLVTECYRACQRFPKPEIYGLCSQLQRPAVSVPANIAEGHGRHSTREYLQHLRIGHGSLMELETHLQIGERLQYLDPESVQRLLVLSGDIGRMLNGLIA
jgi:four helix bundle protein